MDTAPLKKTSFAFIVEFCAFAAVFALAAAAAMVPIPSAPTPTGLAPAIGYFLAAFIGVTALLLLLLRTVHGRHIFSALFSLSVLSGVSLLAYRLAGTDAAVAFFSVAAFLLYAARRVIIYNFVLMLGIAGIAAHLGAGTSPVVIVVLLGILAVYDIVAVYVTGHMVAMADALLRSHVFFAMILPVRPAGFFTKLASVERGNGFLFIGTGDLVLPALLVASAAARTPGAAVWAAVGALLGLVALHAMFVAQRLRRPMPALPPIALGAIAGYLAYVASHLSS